MPELLFPVKFPFARNSPIARDLAASSIQPCRTREVFSAFD